MATRIALNRNGTRHAQATNAGSPNATRRREEQAGRDEEPDRRPELREHAEPRAPSVGRVLDRHQRRPAPFAAEPHALQKAQRGQQPGREDAGRRIARQGADQGGRQPHGEHGRDQRRFPPDPIAEVAEQERADGPCEERDAEGQVGVQGLRFRRRFRKEHRAEHQRRGRAEDVEVVELDRRADEARQHDLSDAGALGLAGGSLDRCHGCPSPREGAAWGWRDGHGVASSILSGLYGADARRRSPLRVLPSREIGRVQVGIGGDALIAMHQALAAAAHPGFSIIEADRTCRPDWRPQCHCFERGAGEWARHRWELARG